MADLLLKIIWLYHFASWFCLLSLSLLGEQRETLIWQINHCLPKGIESSKEKKSSLLFPKPKALWQIQGHPWVLGRRRMTRWWLRGCLLQCPSSHHAVRVICLLEASWTTTVRPRSLKTAWIIDVFSIVKGRELLNRTINGHYLGVGRWEERVRWAFLNGKFSDFLS